MKMKYIEINEFDDLLSIPLDLSKTKCVTIDDVTDGKYLNPLNEVKSSLKITIEFASDYVKWLRKDKPFIGNMFNFDNFGIIVNNPTPLFFQYLSNYFNVYYIDDDNDDKYTNALLNFLHRSDLAYLEYNGRSAYVKDESSFFVSKSVEYGCIPFSKTNYKSLRSLSDDFRHYGSDLQPYDTCLYRLELYIMSHMIKDAHLENGVTFAFKDIGIALNFNIDGYTLYTSGMKHLYSSRSLHDCVKVLLSRFLSSEKQYNSLVELLNG